LLIIIYTSFIPVLIKTGIQHDHLYYIEIWNLDSQGLNPYSIRNGYGPINIALGKLISLNPIAPKLFMLINFAISLLILTLHLKDRIVSRKHIIQMLVLIPLNPLFIYITVIYGLNDTLIASLIIYAVIFNQKNNSRLTGLMLALAALTKVYAIFLVPMFCFKNRKVDWGIVKSFISTFLIGNILSDISVALVDPRVQFK
jgi:Gpi18-like mannosyltransferase